MWRIREDLRHQYINTTSDKTFHDMENRINHLESKVISEKLLAKSEGVKDCVKWMDDEIKKQKRRVESAEKDFKALGCYDDCGDSYKQSLVEEKTRLSTLISTKISMEKYMKKLKHESSEEL